MTDVKRDWLMASDRCAHLMDALQRHLLEVKYQEHSTFGGSLYIRFIFLAGDRDDDRENGMLTLFVHTRSWELTVTCRRGASRAKASLETREVPTWMIEALPPETAATCSRLMIKEGRTQQGGGSDDIPF